MLRPNGHCREIRASNRVSVSDCSVDASKAWGRPRSVPAMPDGAARLVFSSRKIQSGRKTICGGCGTRASSLLDAISSRSALHEPSSTRIRPGIGQRSRRDAAHVDQTEEKAGVYRELTRRSLAATGTTGRTPVRVRRTGTTLPRSRTSTSGCCAPVTHDFRSAVVKARQAVHFNMWSAGQILLRGIRFRVWQSAEYHGWETRGQHS